MITQEEINDLVEIFLPTWYPTLRLDDKRIVFTSPYPPISSKQVSVRSLLGLGSNGIASIDVFCASCNKMLCRVESEDITRLLDAAVTGIGHRPHACITYDL